MWIYTPTKAGRFIPGVPARDLTDAEMKVYRVQKSELYVHVKDSTEDARDEGDSKP